LPARAVDTLDQTTALGAPHATRNIGGSFDIDRNRDAGHIDRVAAGADRPLRADCRSRFATIPPA
jgi:hypothetical protein